MLVDIAAASGTFGMVGYLVLGITLPIIGWFVVSNLRSAKRAAELDIRKYKLHNSEAA